MQLYQHYGRVDDAYLLQDAGLRAEKEARELRLEELAQEGVVWPLRQVARAGGIYLGKRKMCEDCHKKSAHYGLQGNTKRRWCGPCAKRHGGVVYLGTRKMCEDLAAGQPVWHGDAIGRNTKGRRKRLTRRKGKRK